MVDWALYNSWFDFLPSSKDDFSSPSEDEESREPFTMEDLPKRQAMAPRVYIMAQLIEADNAFYFANTHRKSRLGRMGRRPAKKPRYKQMRRGGIRHRKHVRLRVEGSFVMKIKWD